MKNGIVKWFNAQKGYGFITDDGGVDIFVHHTQIQKEGFRTLNQGDKVTFEVGTTDSNSREQAMGVQILESAITE